MVVATMVVVRSGAVAETSTELHTCFIMSYVVKPETPFETAGNEVFRTSLRCFNETDHRSRMHQSDLQEGREICKFKTCSKKV